jgi:hypothetical protein
MMRFLRGDFFRIGGIAYQDFESFHPGQIPANTSLATGAKTTQGMFLEKQTFFTREYVPPPPPPILLKTDNFNRANGSLGTNWDYPIASAVPNRPKIVSNEVQAGVLDTNDFAYWVPDPAQAFRPDQFAQIKLTDPLPIVGAGNFVGVGVRMDNVIDKFYFAVIFGANSYAIFVRTAGVNTQVETGTVATWAIGDVMRLEVRGSGDPGSPLIVTLFQNNIVVLAHHFSIAGQIKTTGSPGLGINSDPVGLLQVDNWNGGDLDEPDEVVFDRDEFNRVDGPMGNPWAFQFAQPHRPRIHTNQVGGQSPDGDANYSPAHWTGQPAHANHYSQVMLATIPGGFPAAVGVVLRAGGGINAYYLGLVHGANDYRIWYWWEDAPGVANYFQVAAGTAQTWAAGKRMRCEITGPNNGTFALFRMYYVTDQFVPGNLVLQYKFDNSTRPNVRVGGFPGLVLFNPAGGALRVDSWEGGPI